MKCATRAAMRDVGNLATGTQFDLGLAQATADYGGYTLGFHLEMIAIYSKTPCNRKEFAGGGAKCHFQRPHWPLLVLSCLFPHLPASHSRRYKNDAYRRTRLLRKPVQRCHRERQPKQLPTTSC